MAESILGALLFGQDPGKLAKKLPPAPQLDLSGAVGQATQAGLTNLPKIEELASKYNEFSSSELAKMMETALPGYGKTVAKGGQQVLSLLSGQLPKDVIDQLNRQGAEKGFTQGAGGSSFSGFGTLRDIGLTSLDAIKSGFSAFNTWVATAAKPHMFDFSNLLPSTGQALQVQQFNETQRFGHDWLKTQLEEMPKPWENAVRGLMDWVATTGESAASLYATKGMSTGQSASRPDIGSFMGGGSQGSMFSSGYQGDPSFMESWGQGGFGGPGGSPSFE